MKIVIQSQGTMAIYEQIVNQLKQAIISRELVVGEALPSIRALASELQVSVITTKRAYEELEKEGLIRSVAGKGFYVCEFNTDYLREKQLMLFEKMVYGNHCRRQTGRSDKRRDCTDGTDSVRGSRIERLL